MTKTAHYLVFSGIVLPHVHASMDDSIRVVLIGCGGRDSGAASDALTVANAQL